VKESGRGVTLVVPKLSVLLPEREVIIKIDLREIDLCIGGEWNWLQIVSNCRLW
jgi:hypothetical protein